MDVSSSYKTPQSIAEESFNITKNDRLSLVAGDKGTSRIKKFENQSGAYIHIDYDNTNNAILKIYGYSSQREKAKILIRDTLEETSFIPMVSNLILTESVCNLLNRKLKFVKCERDDNSNGKTDYFIEFSHAEEYDVINEITNQFEDVRITTPSQFNTFDKIEECLDHLSLKLKSNFKQSSENSLFSEKIILKPRIFFGKVLFSEINHPEEFTLQEWYRLNRRYHRGSDYNGYDVNDKSVNVEFQQYSPQIYERLLKQQFGFKFDNKQVIEGVDKGNIYIYYIPLPNKRRKLKLRWDEIENRWKITNHSHSITRTANMDIISGTKAPDFRFSLKTHYVLPPEGSNVEETINRIQIAQNFVKRDGMYFRSKDFEGTSIKKAVVRQIIGKKRFRNGKFLITFSTIKHDDGLKITIQKLITLKHLSWTQEIDLDNGRFMNDINDTLYYVKDMMDSLV